MSYNIITTQNRIIIDLVQTNPIVQGGKVTVRDAAIGGDTPMLSDEAFLKAKLLYDDHVKKQLAEKKKQDARDAKKKVMETNKADFEKWILDAGRLLRSWPWLLQNGGMPRRFKVQYCEDHFDSLRQTRICSKKHGRSTWTTVLREECVYCLHAADYCHLTHGRDLYTPALRFNKVTMSGCGHCQYDHMVRWWTTEVVHIAVNLWLLLPAPIVRSLFVDYLVPDPAYRTQYQTPWGEGTAAMQAPHLVAGKKIYVLTWFPGWRPLRRSVAQIVNELPPDDEMETESNSGESDETATQFTISRTASPVSNVDAQVINTAEDMSIIDGILNEMQQEEQGENDSISFSNLADM